MTSNKDNLTFSKRFGIESIEIPFQIDAINKILRTELWNAFYIDIFQKYERSGYFEKDYFKDFHRTLWVHFFKKPLDEFPRTDFEFLNLVKNHIETGKWNKVYEFYEFVMISIEGNRNYTHSIFESYINSKLREHNSAYSLFNNKFIRVTNEAEINELRETQNSVKQYGLNGIALHLNSAIEMLSKKPLPDFRNSIKESISMVEVIARIIEPNETTLGKALNKLDKHEKINGTLKSGFEKLYAFTNDKNGIRHGLMDETTLDYEDAKFFLISCSAFTNYLIEKAKKDNLLTIAK